MLVEKIGNEMTIYIYFNKHVVLHASHGSDQLDITFEVCL